MLPEYRLHFITITATLFAWHSLVTKILTIDAISWLGTPSGVIAAYASTIGAYQTIHRLIALVLGNWRWLKKHVFGKYYIEGTWVGYYYGEDEKVRYVVDIVQQEIGYPTRLHGEGFLADNRLYARWDSLAAAFYNNGSGLIFAYECDILIPPQKVDGITDFYLSRMEGQRIPSRITRGGSG